MSDVSKYKATVLDTRLRIFVWLRGDKGNSFSVREQRTQG